MVLPFGALAAARLNAEHGGNHSVAKLVDWCLSTSARIRVGWGAVRATWGSATAHGLIGSSTDGAGYAFFGNTAWFASQLAPLIRYDHRFVSKKRKEEEEEEEEEEEVVIFFKNVACGSRAGDKLKYLYKY